MTLLERHLQSVIYLNGVKPSSAKLSEKYREPLADATA
jgi:hypothetical protein